MARKPKGYWEKRQTELLKNLEKATKPTINDLIKIYNKATENINEEIRKIYKNYSKDSALSKEVLNQLLNKRETDTYQKNLLKTINNIKDKELKQKLITKYNAPAYSYRISRLQALQDNIDMELKRIAELEEEVTKLRYVKTVDEAYYRNIYDIQKGTGYGFSFSQLDTRTMDILLKQKWIGNANFSQRIWQNNYKLNQFLKINFTADMMTGKSIQKISKELSEYINVGLYNATRLVRTEVNHFANASEMLAYEECGIEEYEFIATLDNATCDRCAVLDKKVFKVKEAREGINCPPMHPNDRCTTVAHFGDEEVENLQRRARDPITGKTYLVGNISYEEWRNQIDNKYGENTLAKYHKMYNNTNTDKEQYNRYKNVIGKESVPSTFAKFQDLKYNNSSEYRLTKYNYKLQNEAIHNPQDVIENISIAEEKYTKYLFDGTNEKGLIKGELINKVLGYNKDNYKEFDKLIKENISKFPSRYKGTDQYGDKYEINMVLKGLNERQAKLTIGVRIQNNECKLTTVYINELKENEIKYDKK